MKIQINGQPYIVNTEVNSETEQTTDNGKSLYKIVERFGAMPPFALAVNGQFVPKSQHAHYQINEHDVIDILSPVQGG